MSKLALTGETKLDLSQVTVLLNSGSPRETDVMMQIFAGFGARQIRRAETAETLRYALSIEAVDLLMIDTAQNTSDMLDVVRDLRRMTSETRYAPAVLVTTSVRESLLTEARNAGVSYIMNKPLTPGILFKRLLWLVRESRKFIETESYAGPDRRARSFGPPEGMTGRRFDDLSAEVGDAKMPNMTQADIDALLMPVRKSV